MFLKVHSQNKELFIIFVLDKICGNYHFITTKLENFIFF